MLRKVRNIDGKIKAVLRDADGKKFYTTLAALAGKKLKGPRRKQLQDQISDPLLMSEMTMRDELARLTRKQGRSEADDVRK